MTEKEERGGEHYEPRKYRMKEERWSKGEGRIPFSKDTTKSSLSLLKTMKGWGNSKSFSNWRMSQKTEVRSKVERVKTARKKRRSYKHSVFLKFPLTLKSSMNMPLPLSDQNVKLFLLKNWGWKKRSLRNIINNFQTVISEWKNH